jgi:hypothetical protein
VEVLHWQDGYDELRSNFDRTITAPGGGGRMVGCDLGFERLYDILIVEMITHVIQCSSPMTSPRCRESRL